MTQPFQPLAKVWSFVKSKKLAVFLISSITIAVIIDVFILASEWEPASPAPTNLGQRYGSPWFQGLVITLLINLSACTIDSAIRRIKQGAKSLYLWGSTVFHVGLIIVLFGTMMTGNLRLFATIKLIQGEPKNIPYTGFIQDDFSWNDEPKISFLLNNQTIDVNTDGTIKEIFSEVSISENGKTPTNTTLAEEEQVTYRGLYLYPSEWGYALRMTYSGPQGRSAQVSLPLDTQEFQEGVRAFNLIGYKDNDLPFSFSLNFYPDLTEKNGNASAVNRSYQLRNPSLYIQAQSAGKMFSQKLLRPGETYDVDGYTLTFKEAIPWTQLTAVYDPGAKVVFVGILLATAGLTLLFLFRGPTMAKKDPEVI